MNDVCWDPVVANRRLKPLHQLTDSVPIQYLGSVELLDNDESKPVTLRSGPCAFVDADELLVPLDWKIADSTCHQVSPRVDW